MILKLDTVAFILKMTVTINTKFTDRMSIDVRFFKSNDRTLNPKHLQGQKTKLTQIRLQLGGYLKFANPKVIWKQRSIPVWTMMLRLGTVL